MEQTACLMTAYGDLLCRDGQGRPTRRAFLEAGDDAIEIPAGPTGSGADFVRFVVGDAAPRAIGTGPLAGFELRPGRGGGLVSLRRDGNHLHAMPGGGVSDEQREPTQESSFLPIAGADRRLLRGILEQDWILRSTLAPIVPKAMRLRWPFTLELAETGYDLRHQMPIEGGILPYRVSLFRSGWRFDELCLHRPLIHIACFGNEAARRLPAILRSLIEPAAYAGHVLVLTERTREAVLAASPFDGKRLFVRTVEAASAAEQALARYASLDTPDLLRFQPVLMMDASTLADADLSPLLGALAASDRIAAPLEDAARRRVSPFAGLSLVQQDGIDLRNLAGLDPAILGIPNVATHAHALRLVRRIIANRAFAGGHAPTPPWLEQEVVNYVAVMCEPFDTHLFERFLGGPGQPLRRFAADHRGRALLEAHLRPSGAVEPPEGVEGPVGPAL